MYQNRASLIGFLGQDAGVHATKTTGKPYTVLSLATKRSWKNRETGGRVSETTWHRCIAWGKLADFAATLTKGTHVQIEGDIRTREYVQHVGGNPAVDVKKTVTEIRVASIAKLDRVSRTDQTESATPQEVPV